MEENQSSPLLKADLQKMRLKVKRDRLFADGKIRMDRQGRIHTVRTSGRVRGVVGYG